MSWFLVLSILMTQAWSSSFDFLSEVEDVEKEMWWVITNRRSHSAANPYRALQKALNESTTGKKSSLKITSCSRFKVEVLDQKSHKVFTTCRQRPVWIGTLTRESKETGKWKMEIPLEAWTSHFGIGVSIFHSKLLCDLVVSPQGRLQEMKCPIYARNRTIEEFVEINDFQFQKGGMPVMKIEGTVKRPPEVLGKIESVVPIDGEIRVKETRYPRKEEKIEFEHQTQGDKNGQKDNEKSESKNESEGENEKNGEEKGEGEAPPIKEVEAPPPSR